MHESSVARHVLEIVLSQAAGQGARRVHRVTGRVAEAEALSVESLSAHFQAQASRTIAAGARLDLALFQVQARCRACTKTFDLDHHFRICPGCGSADLDVLGQPGVWIEALEVE